jgi:outer membrane protein insertion porin family
VRGVVIKGNKRTREHIIERELQEAYQADTLDGVGNGLVGALQRLRSLGIFSRCDITVRPADPARHTPLDSDGFPTESFEAFGPLRRGDVELVVSVEERGVANATAGAYAQGDESTAEVSGTLWNPLGYAEKVECSFGLGSKSSSSYQISVSKTEPYMLPGVLGLRAFRDGVDFSEPSSYRSLQRGFGATLATRCGTHTFAYDLVHRSVVPAVSGGARSALEALSQAALEAGGLKAPCARILAAAAEASVKSSVSHVASWDDRDHPQAPTRGRMLRIKTELAGLGGDAMHVKTRAEAQWLQPLTGPFLGGPGAALKGTAQLGGLVPLGADAWRRDNLTGSRLHDRFFLGGPGSLKGFARRGAGGERGESGVRAPHRDALGGDLVAAGTVALHFPFPLRAAQAAGLRGLVHLSAGQLAGWSTARERSARDWAATTRTSCGVGVLLPTPMGPLSLTWSRALNLGDGDVEQRFQLGLGNIL